MELEEFDTFVETHLNALFSAAKEKDEFAYVFAMLGLNSGAEDAGWEPFRESHQLFCDFVELSRAPLQCNTKIRLLLMAYCQITESSFLYHIIYNLLLALEGQTPPKVFNFLDQYQRGNPPSVKSKVKQICTKASELNHEGIKDIFDATFYSNVRNAVSHADYILFEDEFRLKHRGDELKKIPFNDLNLLLNKAFNFYQRFFLVLHEHKTSYKDGDVIKNRKSKSGHDLAEIELKVDENHGLYGIRFSGPAPLWDPAS